MPIQCPTCSRVNPANAVYCFYDGRSLDKPGQNGPTGLGTMRFPLPFSFSDGLGCADFNQLAIACDRRWSEARSYLVNGTWASFFSSIGRTDLATLALMSARETDPDLGLCRLLEGLPADPEALRPPKLGLPSTTEDLGELAPGKDHKLDLVIENQGVLMLRGSVTTSCDWLLLGDPQGNSSAKLFQTRDSYTLTVRVVGNKLRAAKKPLEGQIVIDTNGGRETLVLRAAVPIRPFPRGPGGNNVLAGATTPRDLAVKAKAHPLEAAVLFEQGVVKAWYESNGWTYPIPGTQARGKGALQQFFEALGLTKPPRLAINTERIECQGEAGQRLTKQVTIRTTEARVVYADAFSDQQWIKVLPTKSQGNSVTVPLGIEIPPRPGETLHARVTFQGNGQQRFVVPVTVTVEGLTPQQEEEIERRRRRRTWIGAAIGLSLFLAAGIGFVLFLSHRNLGQDNPPPDPRGGQQGQQGQQGQPAAKGPAWWDAIPDNHLTAAVAKLKELVGEDRPIFDVLEAGSESDRRKGYEQLAAKLPELARNPAIREPLGQFVTECCVYEPFELNISPLVRGLAGQFPTEDRPFPPGDNGESVERACFWLRVACDAITSKAVIPPERRRLVASALDTVFGSALVDAPPDQVKDLAEKALAEMCYHNTLPTADKSIEQALFIRQALLAKFPRYLGPEFRDQDDVKLLALGLSRGSGLWPKLEPLFVTCAKSNQIEVGFKLIDLYEKANAEVAPKMEALLAVRWKVAGNAKLTQAAKGEAIRRSLAATASAAKISHEERVKQLQELVAKLPSAPGKPDGPQEKAQLQDSVRRAHASTMAAILFSKDAEVWRFDELIGRAPSLEQKKPAPEKERPEERPQQPVAKDVIDVGAGWTVQDQLTAKNERDPRRESFRKDYSVRLQGGQIYYLYMRSNTLKPYLRLESVAGARLDSASGANAQIVFHPKADGVYRVVASTADKDAVGQFTVQITQQQQIFGFGMRRFPRIGIPQVPAEAPGEVEKKAPQLNLSDLKDLGDRQGKVRMVAFKNLAGSLPNDLAYRHAQKIANYLLLTEWEDSELAAVTDQLPSLASCRPLLQALEDGIANGEKLSQQRTETVVGGLVGKQLRFARDEHWRSACRELLLQRAVKLTERPATSTNDADIAADFLRDLYKEQGLAFGLDAPDFEEQTQLTVVLERLIQHVAARAAQQQLPPADKAYLEQVGRQLQATRFVASNDLEHTVLLQRIWIKVLVLALQGQGSAQAQKMLAVQQDLEKKDFQATNLLDQLRSGEERILRVWAIVHDLKFK